MEKNRENINMKVEFEKNILNSFAFFLSTEIRQFYESEKGKRYYENWLTEHPEYRSTQNNSAHLS